MCQAEFHAGCRHKPPHLVGPRFLGHRRRKSSALCINRGPAEPFTRSTILDPDLKPRGRVVNEIHWGATPQLLRAQSRLEEVTPTDFDRQARFGDGVFVAFGNVVAAVLEPLLRGFKGSVPVTR
jgi:hypothetical protein